MSIRKQCTLLTVNRSSLYYRPKGESPENLKIMQIMDKHAIDELVPFVKQLLSLLKLMIVFKQPRNRPGKVFCLEEKNGLYVGCNSL